MKTKLSVFAAFLLTLLLSGSAVFAATRTWDGSSSGLWVTAANWDINTVPANGDALMFPGGPARLLTTNSPGGATNFTALTLTGSNYFLFSPPLSITNGMTNASGISTSNTINAVLSVSRPASKVSINPG